MTPRAARFARRTTTTFKRVTAAQLVVLAGAAQGAHKPWLAALKHIEANPMRVQGLYMVYDADPQMAMPPALDGLTERSFGPCRTQSQLHYARCCLALLYLACDGLDMAHNLITPLCWDAPTPYSGRPVPNSPARQTASYVHVLVHRREGEKPGEFGTGFRNSSFWVAQTGTHEVHRDLLPRIQLQLQKRKLGAAEAFLEQCNGQWLPLAFIQLCSTAVDKRDEPLLAACAAINNEEWRALFDYCLVKARA